MYTPSTLRRTRMWYHYLDTEQRRVVAALLALIVVLLIANAVLWNLALSRPWGQDVPEPATVTPLVITDVVQL